VKNGKFPGKVNLYGIWQTCFEEYTKEMNIKNILPLTVLKRFDCVLSDTKKDILTTYDKYKNGILKILMMF